MSSERMVAVGGMVWLALTLLVALAACAACAFSLTGQYWMTEANVGEDWAIWPASTHVHYAHGNALSNPADAFLVVTDLFSVAQRDTCQTNACASNGPVLITYTQRYRQFLGYNAALLNTNTNELATLEWAETNTVEYSCLGTNQTTDHVRTHVRWYPATSEPTAYLDAEDARAWETHWAMLERLRCLYGSEYEAAELGRSNGLSGLAYYRSSWANLENSKACIVWMLVDPFIYVGSMWVDDSQRGTNATWDAYLSTPASTSWWWDEEGVLWVPTATNYPGSPPKITNEAHLCQLAGLPIQTNWSAVTNDVPGWTVGVLDQESVTVTQQEASYAGLYFDYTPTRRRTDELQVMTSTWTWAGQLRSTPGTNTTSLLPHHQMAGWSYAANEGASAGTNGTLTGFSLRVYATAGGVTNDLLPLTTWTNRLHTQTVAHVTTNLNIAAGHCEADYGWDGCRAALALLKWRWRGAYHYGATEGWGGCNTSVPPAVSGYATSNLWMDLLWATMGWGTYYNDSPGTGEAHIVYHWAYQKDRGVRVAQALGDGALTNATVTFYWWLNDSGGPAMEYVPADFRTNENSTWLRDEGIPTNPAAPHHLAYVDEGAWDGAVTGYVGSEVAPFAEVGEQTYEGTWPVDQDNPLSVSWWDLPACVQAYWPTATNSEELDLIRPSPGFDYAVYYGGFALYEMTFSKP